jgi:hypothetical protein
MGTTQARGGCNGDGEADREDYGKVADVAERLVFMEDDVPNPVEFVFDAPMGATGESKQAGAIGGGSVGDEISGGSRGSMFVGADPIDANDGGDIGPGQLSASQAGSLDRDQSGGAAFLTSMVVVVDRVGSSVFPIKVLD